MRIADGVHLVEDVQNGRHFHEQVNGFRLVVRQDAVDGGRIGPSFHAGSRDDHVVQLVDPFDLTGRHVLEARVTETRVRYEDDQSLGGQGDVLLAFKVGGAFA